MREYGIQLARLRSKGDELQSRSVEQVASRAASKLVARYGRPLFVEDTGLYVRSLGGFPGAYASFAYGTIGPEGLLKLLSGEHDRSAVFVSAVSFAGRSRRPRTFTGRLKGSIAHRPSGRRGFGFDPIFIPEGSGASLAQLSMGEKCEVSHRARALRALARWLVSSRSGESL